MERVYRFGKLCLGAFISGLGIAIAMNTGLGADPITVFFEGLSKVFGITIGMASIITMLGMTVVAFIIERKQVGLGTLVTPFFVQMGIDLLMPRFPQITSFPWNYAVMFSGLVVCAFGIAMAISANIGQQGTDALILSLSNRFKLPYHVVRWGTDGALLVVGILLGGNFNVATVLATLTLGKTISFIYSHVFNRTETI
ncbi:hypothetical protein G7062_04100 [Erysipelothrix sp. HDW6C]|uniref:YczE/YyaS/YitT family protein n=1 Tax=Erysipelothrix sp. HDW6C TaxID=2714930 RepID=UPI00140C7237|nr:YitT family protein [Erysipelothrix sp. HDW6C]QIK69527.1 hypothetical protein G7062_04100 [Erysipelothrix sp. HDW6C]